MRTRRSAKLFATAIAIAVSSAAIAYWRAFTTMVSYDDEGTMMISIQRFFEGKPLYDVARSIYGPVYYFYEWLAHVVTGLPVSHDMVRWASATWWVAGGLVLFALVYRATGSLLLAAAAHYIGFRDLGFIGHEAAHPQEACVALLLAAALAATMRRARAAWFLLGALTAAMALTKINVAIFFLAALGVVFTMGLPRGRLRQVLVGAASFGALALAPLLMAPFLSQSWALKYSGFVMLSLAASILIAARARFEPPASVRDAAVTLAGFAVAAMAISAFPLSRGTTVYGMIYSLIIWPKTHFTLLFTRPLRIPPWSLVWAAANLALAFAWRMGRIPDTVPQVLKIGLAVLAAWASLTYHFHELVWIGTPMLWLVLATRSDGLLRPLLAIGGVLQVLYAFPVAGTQVRFGTVLTTAIAAICLYDALPWLQARLPRLRAIPAAAALLLIGAFAHDAYSAHAKYASLEPLGLPGAERLRVEPDRTATLRHLAAAAQPCSVLVSEPGLFSLNFLSRKPAPPSMPAAGAWMLFANDAEQQATVAELERDPRACAVVSRELVDFWVQGPDVSAKPLVRYIRDAFRPVFEDAGYQFLVRR